MGEKLSRDQIRVAGKFILLQLADLVCDGVGRPKYVTSLDNVIEDLFGYKKLASKISACRNDTGMIGVVLDFGLQDLFTITDNARTMAVLSDLVTMDRSLMVLRKELKKGSKKGGANKKRQKEYNYISDLYKKTVKTLRKDLGLSAKNPYKNQFKSARNFLESESESSFFDDYGYGRSIFITDDDDDEDGSLFAQFVSKHARNSKVKRPTNPNSHMFTRSKEDGFEHLIEQYDSDDDADEDDDIESRRSGVPHDIQIESKIDHLTAAVQQLINVGMSKPIIPTMTPPIPSNASSDIAAYLTTVSNNEAAILDAIGKLSHQVTENDRRFTTLASAVHEIVQMLNDVDDDENDTDDDPVASPQEYQDLLQRQNAMMRAKFGPRHNVETAEPGDGLTQDEIADVMLRAQTRPIVTAPDRTPAEQMNDVTATIPTTPPPVQKEDDSPVTIFNQRVEVETRTVVEESPISRTLSDAELEARENATSDEPIAAEEVAEAPES